MIEPVIYTFDADIQAALDGLEALIQKTDKASTSAEKLTESAEKLSESAKKVGDTFKESADAVEEFNKAWDEEKLEDECGTLDDLNEKAITTGINFKQLALAFGTITAASLGLAVASDRVTDLERSTGRSAITFGQTTEGMYKYVQSLSSASDRQEEVGATMEYLARAGVEWGDDLTSVYQTMDLLGDATDKSSTEIAQSVIPTFRALGLEISDVTKYADALAYAANNTTFDIGNWAYITRVYGSVLKENNIDMGDSIALMTAFEERGMNVRTMRIALNSALKEVAKSTTEQTNAEKELLGIQEKLNNSQKTSADITRMYRYDMKMAGGDIKERVRLSNAYAREMESRKGETSTIQAQLDAKKAEIATLKAAPKVKLLDVLEKEYPGITKLIKNPPKEVAGAAERYAEVGHITTGKERAEFTIDQMKQAIGEGVPTDVSENLYKLSAISGTLTGISTVLALIQGYSLMTATSTSAMALQSGGVTLASMKGVLAAGGLTAAGAVAGGVALGAVGVYGLEATGTTTLGQDLSGKTTAENAGTIEKSGMWWRERLTGEMSEAERQYIRSFTIKGEIPPEYKRDEKGNIVKKEPGKTLFPELGFAEGGTVQAPEGEPVAATVHGGETVLSLAMSENMDALPEILDVVTDGVETLNDSYDLQEKTVKQPEVKALSDKDLKVGDTVAMPSSESGGVPAVSGASIAITKQGVHPEPEKGAAFEMATEAERRGDKIDPYVLEKAIKEGFKSANQGLFPLNPADYAKARDSSDVYEEQHARRFPGSEPVTYPPLYTGEGDILPEPVKPPENAELIAASLEAAGFYPKQEPVIPEPRTTTLKTELNATPELPTERTTGLVEAMNQPYAERTYEKPRNDLEGVDIPALLGGIASAIKDLKTANESIPPSITIQKVEVTKDVPFDKLMGNFQNMTKSQRVARGIRSV